MVWHLSRRIEINIARIDIPLIKSSFTKLAHTQIKELLNKIAESPASMDMMLDTKEYGWIIICKSQKTYVSERVVQFYSPRMTLEEDLTISKIGVCGIGFTSVSLPCLGGDIVQFTYEVQR